MSPIEGPDPLGYCMQFFSICLQRSPFYSTSRSLVQLLSMTAGGFDFGSLFRLSPDGESEEAEEIPYLAVSYILWVIFIILMPILLINLLVCIAISIY